MRSTLHSTAPAGLGTILVVCAHPDDETYLAGGIMAAARDQGQRVVCVSATAGELGTDDPDDWPPHRLGPVRRWEAAAAMAVLGVSEHAVLDLADGGLDPHDESAVERILRMVATIEPDTILTFGPDGMTYHPDHIAVHHWVTRAWRRSGATARLLYATPTVEFLAEHGEALETWNMYMTDQRPDGVPVERLAVHHRLAGPELDRKLTALRAMATQTSGLIAGLAPEAYAAQISEECFVDARPLASVASRVERDPASAKG